MTVCLSHSPSAVVDFAFSLWLAANMFEPALLVNSALLRRRLLVAARTVRQRVPQAVQQETVFENSCENSWL